ncbi:hypothetical protein AAFC00_004344 [Neodothiora populina]|uniref:Uncharacterized protein n=1 Tax=Neodothiora populina TaxID=2781224 RepID=A0ABR3PJE3_9PEZI
MAVQSTIRSETTVEAKSSHVEDPSLQPFLHVKFDAADYLNTTLPSLSFSDASRDAQASRVSLAELASRTQSLMSQLNAHTSRLTNTLNQLTDEILRSGSRLAYEVEILRGETLGLSDALSEGLQEDIAHFVPNGLQAPKAITEKDASLSPDSEDTEPSPSDPKISNEVAEPEYIERLRTLTKVRARLDSVIQVFGEAMKWPIAPSELSSSLISVSAPSAGGPEATRDLEEKGKEYAQNLRNEVQDVLHHASTAEEGIEAAIKRIEEQRTLASVWNGTAEEKARLKLVDSLMKPVEDEQKALARKTEAKRRTASPSTGVDYRYGDSTNTGRQGGYGFIQNLQKLKNDIYLD